MLGGPLGDEVYAVHRLSRVYYCLAPTVMWLDVRNLHLAMRFGRGSSPLTACRGDVSRSKPYRVHKLQGLACLGVVRLAQGNDVPGSICGAIFLDVGSYLRLVNTRLLRAVGGK